MAGAMKDDPDNERVVSVRLVLPMPAIPNMLESFRQMERVMTQAQAARRQPN
jgi:hypothetical protein